MTERTRKIGILAYGSLIDDPGDELSRAISQRIEDVLTPFPVEFARKSASRGDAPTLVPHANGTRVHATILVLNSSTRHASDMVGRCSDTSLRYPGPRPNNANAVQVECISKLGGVDTVLYTCISANVVPLTAERLADLAIASVAKAPRGLDGISYLIAAKGNGIITALSPTYEAEILHRTSSYDLATALSALYSQ